MAADDPGTKPDGDTHSGAGESTPTALSNLGSADTAGIILPRRLVSAAVILAVLPAFGVYLAYLYELGYTSWFNLDPSVIEISTATVIAAALRFGALLIIGALLAQSVVFGAHRVAFQSWRWLYGYTLGEFALILLALWWVANDFEVPRPNFVAIGAAALVVVALVWLAAFEKEDEPSWGRLVTQLIRSGYFPIVSGFIFLSLFSYWNGNGDARHQKYFLVLENDRQIVVLREYGSRLIAARRAVGDDRVDARHIFLLSAGDPDSKEFLRLAVGPLSPK